MSAPLWAAQPPVSVVAPAKLNLFLHIVGRRDDGYHLLESLFAFTRAGDVVTVSAAPELSFDMSGPFGPVLQALGGGGEGNLIVKAAKLLAARAGLEPNVAISLEKNLPVAAGIGGGSADAAAALLALNAFWKLDLSVAELEPLALELGADVPACLYKAPLYVEGIGERLTPVKLGWKKGVLLVNPRVEVPTPDVFRAFHQNGGAFDTPLEDAAGMCGDFAALCQETHNALEAPASAICPAVGLVLEVLESQEGPELVRMSGSGATCFALFNTEAAAKAAEGRINAAYSNWWTMADGLA